jgi:hypothetical protein
MTPQPSVVITAERGRRPELPGQRVGYHFGVLLHNGSPLGIEPLSVELVPVRVLANRKLSPSDGFRRYELGRLDFGSGEETAVAGPPLATTKVVAGHGAVSGRPQSPAEFDTEAITGTSTFATYAYDWSHCLTISKP